MILSYNSDQWPNHYAKKVLKLLDASLDKSPRSQLLRKMLITYIHSRISSALEALKSQVLLPGSVTIKVLTVVAKATSQSKRTEW